MDKFIKIPKITDDDFDNDEDFKIFKLQRKKYGVSYFEALSLSHYLAPIIYNGLKFLKESYTIYNINDEKTSTMKEKLSVMMKSFQLFIDHNNRLESNYDDKELEEMNKGFELFSKYFLNLHI
jgi:hypothetical protein